MHVKLVKLWETFVSLLTSENRLLICEQVLLAGKLFCHVMPCWLVWNCTAVGCVYDVNDKVVYGVQDGSLLL